MTKLLSKNNKSLFGFYQGDLLIFELS